MTAPRREVLWLLACCGIGGLVFGLVQAFGGDPLQPRQPLGAPPEPGSQHVATPEVQELHRSRAAVPEGGAPAVAHPTDSPKELPQGFSELIAMHLQPAPSDLQQAALVRVEATRASLAERLHEPVPTATSAAIDWHDEAYMMRLAELVTLRLKEGRGQLAVESQQPDPGLTAKNHWTVPSVAVVAGLQVGVFVDVGEGDPVLQQHTAAIAGLRRTLAHEQAGVFNRRPDAERRSAVDQFERKFTQTNGKDWQLFGIQWPGGDFLRIDHDSATLLLR